MTDNLTSNPVSKEMRDCFQGTIDQYSGQTHYVDCWRDHWPCALARTLDEIDRLTERLAGAYASVNLLTEMLEAKAPQEATGIYESAWVIEGMWSSTAYPEYWVGSSAWSSDPYKALRFASKQSAQQAADMMLVGINHRVACHEFAGNSHHE